MTQDKYCPLSHCWHIEVESCCMSEKPIFNIVYTRYTAPFVTITRVHKQPIRLGHLTQNKMRNGYTEHFK